MPNNKQKSGKNSYEIKEDEDLKGGFKKEGQNPGQGQTSEDRQSQGGKNRPGYLDESDEEDLDPMMEAQGEDDDEDYNQLQAGAKNRQGQAGESKQGQHADKQHQSSQDRQQQVGGNRKEQSGQSRSKNDRNS